MKVLIDLQSCQGTSRWRGIGRYSFLLAKAMVQADEKHSFAVLLNGAMPDTIADLKAAFAPLVGPDNVHVWHPVPLTASISSENLWRRKASEYLREAVIAEIAPDVVHVTSLFDGYGDGAVHSIGLMPQRCLTAVTLYDLIPLVQRKTYLNSDALYAEFYNTRLDYLRRADLLLAISDFSRQESIELLGFDPDAVVNISAAADTRFQPVSAETAYAAPVWKRTGITRRVILYSGATDSRKNHVSLIKAYAALPRQIRETHQLVLAGGMPKAHRDTFAAVANTAGLLPDEMVMTGRVTDEELVSLYSQAALYVFPSLHEGFGLPALEAMQCGAPVIASNTSSLPEVLGRSDVLFDPTDPADIARKIEYAIQTPERIQTLIDEGLAQARNFSWSRSAKLALAAMERAVDRSRRKSAALPAIDYQALLVKQISEISPASPVGGDVFKTARAIALNAPRPARRRLYVDVSQLHQHDARTGIQRVVRAILSQLLQNPPSGFDVFPVWADEVTPGYRHASALRSDILGQDIYTVDEPIDYGNGDIFLGLDLQHFVVLAQAQSLKRMHTAGVRVCFVVYDLLPILWQQGFDNELGALHARWLRFVSQFDGLIAISRAVADEAISWLYENGDYRSVALPVGWFHLGADIQSSKPTRGRADNADDLLAKWRGAKTFLMVGTVEPRKGHAQVLEAFQRLWRAGRNINLVIVGKRGWQVDGLVETINAHPELNRRLFWVQNVSDQFLEEAYAASACLIAASYAEGFGLPLVEAAIAGIPLLVRDIPVFREVAGDFARYFAGEDAESLERAILAWLAADSAQAMPGTGNMPRLSWRESSIALVSAITDKTPYGVWEPSSVMTFPADALRTEIGTSRQGAQKVAGVAGLLLGGTVISLPAGVYMVSIHGHSPHAAAGAASFEIVVRSQDAGVLLSDRLHPLPGDFCESRTVQLDYGCSAFDVSLVVDAGNLLEVSEIEIRDVTDRPR